MIVRRLVSRGLFALTLAGMTLALAGASASAAVEHEFLFSFGPGGPGAIAVDQSSGDVYVVSGSSLFKFNSAGEPQEFSGLKADAIENFGGGRPGSLAVDNSSGPAKGDIYTATGGSVEIYGEDGLRLGELTGPSAAEVPGAPPEWAGVEGVGVDAKGNVYAAVNGHHSIQGGYVSKYTPSGNPVKNSDYVSMLIAAREGSGAFGILQMAVDGEGDVYTTTNSAQSVLKFSASQFGQIEPQYGVAYRIAPVFGFGGGGLWLAVDPTNGDLYTGENNQGIQQYDSSDKLLDSFAASGPGAAGSKFGIAVNGLSKEVYIADVETGLINVFSLPAVLAASTNAVSGVTVHTAILEGAVNPGGSTVKSCEFEYGPTASYGSLVSCLLLPAGAGRRYVKVSAEVQGLSPYTLYHYRLVASAGHATTRGEDKTFTTGKVPATVNGKVAFASNVTPLSATLNGTIDPGNLPTAYHFMYGPTAAYGSVAPSPDGLVPVNNADDPITQVLSGLDPGTVYHFALVASSPMGTVVGPDETFTTPPVPSPVVGTGGASGVNVNSVTLSGSVDPQGWETSYFFEYGSSVAYGARWPGIPVMLGGLTGSQPVVAFVQNLLPGTTYHYRLVATNPGGASYGPDEVFTTSEYPVSVIAQAPLSGPLGITLPVSKPKSKKTKHKKSRVKKRKRGRK
jgi:hypothetical protein